MPADTTVTALVDFGREGAGFKLGVELKVKAPGLTADETKKLVDAAHQVCPYSVSSDLDLNLY